MTEGRSTETLSKAPPGAFPWWRRISIHTKLQLSAAGFSFIVLLVCAASLTWAANRYFHEKIHRDLAMLANVLAYNVQAAVTFDDKQSAFDILSALRGNSHIKEAVIYKGGRLFTIYPENVEEIKRDHLRTENGIWLQDDRYFASVPIRLADETLGQLVLVSDLEEWNQVRRALYFLFSGLFGGLFVLTLLLSAWLKRQIGEPLASLSAWATGISRDKNFSAHAEKRNQDEIGELVDSLNTMLSELSKQRSIMSWNEQLQKEIQERRRVEQELIEMRDRAEAASHAKSRFLANMSHEIRTPMNAIIGFINIILEGELGEEQRKQLETVKRSAKSLHSLLNDILDVAKLEQEKLELEAIPFSAIQVVDDVIEIFQARAKEKGIQLVRKIAHDVPQALMGDPFRLNQVLTNLVGNAIKFTNSDGLVQVVLEKLDDRLLKFSIVDTGIGIPKDKQENIFKSFGQADSSTSRRFGGTGLGTAISKQLVELMGGEIGFESEENVGSTFFFTLEINLADVKDLAKPDSQELRYQSMLNPGKALKILVAEDIIENAELLKVRLERLGHKLVHALNGKEALQYFERQDFDIILMDVHMPEVDGLTATRAIRASDRGKDIPILALTASVLKEDRDNCAEAGMDGFVTKPIMFEQLFAEMARVLSLDQPGSQPGDKSGKAGNLPDLPGINYEKAILNWQDEETYVRNLKRFFNRHGDDIAMIRECLKSGDIRNARQGIHALEGVAGNLSLETFFRSLESLGAAIKQDRREEYDALLDKITEAMAQAKASVARLSQTYDTAMAGTGPVDKNKLAENLRRFDQSLAKGQLDDYLLPELVEELKSCGVDGNCIDDFLRALEDFEFDRARKRLEEAAAQIDM